MIIHRYKLFNTVLCAAIVAVGFACSDSTSNTQSEPPELPSMENLRMNFTMFGQDTAAQKAGTSQIQSGEYQNFGTAVVYTIGPKILAEVVLAFPRALLSAAEGADPELNGDGEWEWSFSGSRDGETYEARLLGSTNADINRVIWEMYITADSEEFQADNFLFFEGSTTTNGKEGRWIYYDLFTGQSGSAVLQLDWLIESENKAQLDIEVLDTTVVETAKSTALNYSSGRTIATTPVEPPHSHTTLSYTSDGAIKTLTISDASADETTKIYWNAETHIGYIITPEYNGGEKACWGSDLKNTVCSEVGI